MNNKNYISISDISPSHVKRKTVYYYEIDWLYGFSENGEKLSWGLPSGTISNWIGEGGVGKSRLAIEIAKIVVDRGGSALYFQNEVDLPTFSSWVKSSSAGFYCSEERFLDRQISAIKEIKPDIIIVDSINLLEEFGSGRDENIRKIVETYREAIKGTDSHVIFLCQLNKDGSAKGSTALTHMPDINFILTNEPNGRFRMSVGKKHRYGRTGENFYAILKHTDEGISIESHNRCKDDKWMKDRSDDPAVKHAQEQAAHKAAIEFKKLQEAIRLENEKKQEAIRLENFRRQEAIRQKEAARKAAEAEKMRDNLYYLHGMTEEEKKIAEKIRTGKIEMWLAELCYEDQPYSKINRNFFPKNYKGTYP